MSTRSTATVIIANGASLSGIANVPDGEVVAIQLPTITSAAVTFQASWDGTNFFDLYDKAGTEVTLGSATTGNRFHEAPEAVRSVPYLKVRSGTTAAAVNQGAARTITLVVDPVE